jgi:large-conductance mechanosensitive channel
MVSDCIEFLKKTNALVLAVAVIIGAAIGRWCPPWWQIS